MATKCTISSASLTKPSRTAVLSTSVTIHYQASGELPNSPSEGTITVDSQSNWSYGNITVNEESTERTRSVSRYRHQDHYSYESLTYSWRFSPAAGSLSGASGNVTISSLSSGTAYNVTGTVTATCTRYTQKQRSKQTGTQISTRKDKESSWGSWVTTWDPLENNWENEGGRTPTYNYGTSNPFTTAVVIIYTRPGSFSGFDNIAKDITIQSSSGLSATAVNNWVSHCNKYVHWYNQNGNDTAGNNCKATSGGLITAAWYNNCVDAIPVANRPAKIVKETGKNYYPTISAATIKALATAVSTY